MNKYTIKEIKEALDEYGSVEAAALYFGMCRRNLYYIIDKLGYKVKKSVDIVKK